jgi:ribosomal protein S18 acetylase RimI-like enzyme
MSRMDYRLVAELTDEKRAAIASPLRAYNRAQNPAFYAARDLPENAPKPLNVVATDPAGTVVGGLIGDTHFGWLEVSIIAVAEHVRGLGIGRRLMELAEQEAVARGCRHVHLDTMDYQAPDFYQKLGYQVASKIDDWDSHGHAQYRFTKQIGQQ